MNKTTDINSVSHQELQEGLYRTQSRISKLKEKIKELNEYLADAEIVQAHYKKLQALKEKQLLKEQAKKQVRI